MTGNIKRTTPNYGFRIPYFDRTGWGREMERNFDVADAALFASTGLGGIVGTWTNSTEYDVADRVVDPTDGTIWGCNVDHVSAGTGSFADDRAAHPTYWTAVTSSFAQRMLWTTGTTYNVNDIMYYGYKWAIARRRFVSGASFDGDVANNDLVILFDGTATVDAAELAETNAETAQAAAEYAQTQAANSASGAAAAAGAASASATQALGFRNTAETHKNDAANSASAAAGSATAASGSATTAGTQATNAANSATASATSATQSATARDNAWKWSQENENTAINDGVHTGYSAYHWSAKAAASAAAAATFNPANFVSKVSTDGQILASAVLGIQPSNNNAILELRASGTKQAIIDLSSNGRSRDYDWRITVDAATERLNFVYNNGASSIFMNTDGNMWSSSYGWFHDKWADRGVRIQHDSGVVEFSGYDTGITDSIGQCSAPYVQIGMRRGNVSAGAASYIRGILLRNN